MNRVPTLPEPPIRAEESPIYRWGRRFLEEPEEALAGLADPNLWLGAAFLAAGGFAAPATSRLAGRQLFGQPGEMVLGRKTGRPFDALLGAHVTQRLSDAFTSTQVVGPPGQGKTTLLLGMAVQNLLAGVTVFVLETGGDLGLQLLPYARALGRPVYYFDPPEPEGTMKWNPLSGDPEKVAEQVVATVITAGASGEVFFENFTAEVLRNLVMTVTACAQNRGEEPTIDRLTRFLTDREFRNDQLGIVDVGKKKGGPVRVDVPGLDDEARLWWEQEYHGDWSPQQRTVFTQGLRSALRRLYGRSIVREALCPAPGEPHFDIGEVLDSGGLIVMRVTQGGAGPASSLAAATWILQRLQQEVLDRPRYSYPVMVYLDELHNIIGHHNPAPAHSFSGYLAQSRQKNVGNFLSYQTFGMLPTHVKEIVVGTALNKLISGGLGPHDAREVQEMMGYEEGEVTDIRHTRSRRILSSFPSSSVSVGRRQQDLPRYTVDDIRAVPRGRWLYSPVRRGRLLPPVLVQARPVPPVWRVVLKARCERLAAHHGWASLAGAIRRATVRMGEGVRAGQRR
jgi:hypothetical protein